MINKKSNAFYTVLVLVFTSQVIWAAPADIIGMVADSTTGEPLPGANVFLEGTGMGDASDINGEYQISNVPAGSYSLITSYIGYETKTHIIQLKEGEDLIFNIELTAVILSTEAVIITAQASGQNAAINQQLAALNIVNVVSSARIQELPDANAAESVGRMPGVSLVRDGGEATQLVIRGLQPQYNTITLDGVSIAANTGGNVSTGGDYATPQTQAGGRAVDLSMISSNSLEGIEVYKTVTPDMDAAVLGGTVNFVLREAEESSSDFPMVSLLSQGTYNDLMNTYEGYNFVASAEQRFLDNRFGVFVQGIAQRQNLISNSLDASYELRDKTNFPDRVSLADLSLSFSPNVKQRYGGTVGLDYRLTGGKIKFLNNISYSNTTNEQHSQTYNLLRNNIVFGTQLWTTEIYAITNILNYEQKIGTFDLDAKLSNSYSDNSTPYGWSVLFHQNSAGINNIDKYEDPKNIARIARERIDLDNMYWAGNSTWNSYNKQNDTQFSSNLKRDFHLSNQLSLTLKTGVTYKYTSRYYNFDTGFGSLYTGAAAGFRNEIILALPWLRDEPYNFAENLKFPIHGFYDENMDFGDFLKGRYGIDSGIDVDAIDKIMSVIKTQGEATTQPENVPTYVPDRYSSKASDYDGNESRSAGYFMGTFNIGTQVTLIGGVRYQGLKTSYRAPQFVGNADAPNPYPGDLQHKWVTKEEYHGYWLPNVTAKYDAANWLYFRASYTNTLAYPDFYAIVPRMSVSSSSGHWAVWNNYALKPAYSRNYDFQTAVYNNYIGLFSLGPFLKNIDNLIFSQTSFISDPSKYPGLPANTETYELTTFINNPEQVNVWGIEAEWQTHFWYLPGALSGLVLNVNYTHIFSEAEYPYTETRLSSGFPPLPYTVDTTYTDRLIDQPDNIVNVSLGFDYKGLSILASMIYQDKVYESTNFYNSLRSDKENYLRWDLVVKQKLPWYNIEAFLNLNNLNGAPDKYAVRGSGFPSSQSHYGLTADFGIRLKL